MPNAAYIPKAKREDWQTPDVALAPVRSALNGGIDLDPCASVDPRDHFALWNINPGPFDDCDDSGRTFHEGSPKPLLGDGLTEPWTYITGLTRPRTFVNPPFAANAKWVAKCAAEAKLGAEVVLLIPARTDTRYWHDHCSGAPAVCFWKGRLTFRGAPNVAPFPVAFVYWGPHPDRFTDAFRRHGVVYANA